VVGEGHGLEVRKQDLERHHLWGRGSCEGILGLGQGPTGINATHVHAWKLREGAVTNE